MNKACAYLPLYEPRIGTIVNVWVGEPAHTTTKETNMPNPDYVIETAGKKVGLAFHLETAFYPPLPDHVRQAFMKAFTKYWDGESTMDELTDELRENAGYIGGLHQYNLYQFLNTEDLH